MNDILKQMANADDKALGSIFSKELTKDEVAMFERIKEMEEIHNAIGLCLGGYKDKIVEIRNKFVLGLCRKYGIEKARDATFDPVSKKIVSVFHPNLKASKIISSGNAFHKVASEIVTSTIQKLAEIYRATNN